MARRRLIFFAALVALFAGSVLAWTQTSTSFQLTITPYNAGAEGGDVGKLVLSVEAIGEPFSIVQGAAQKIRGVELYKIELADKDACDDVRIQLTLLNAYDMGKALNNPHSFIDVGVWYPVPEGATSETVLNGPVDNGTHVLRDDGARASAMMSRADGNVLLYPSKTVTSTLYILASIMVPGGAPPGQQEQLTDLDLWCDVRK